MYLLKLLNLSAMYLIYLFRNFRIFFFFLFCKASASSIDLMRRIEVITEGILRNYECLTVGKGNIYLPTYS